MREGYDEDESGFVRHLESLGVPHHVGSHRDAARVGLDRNTEEGALVAFSGALRPGNPWHRLVAWLLLVSFGLPAVLAVMHLVRELAGLAFG